MMIIKNKTRWWKIRNKIKRRNLKMLYNETKTFHCMFHRLCYAIKRQNFAEHFDHWFLGNVSIRLRLCSTHRIYLSIFKHRLCPLVLPDLNSSRVQRVSKEEEEEIFCKAGCRGKTLRVFVCRLLPDDSSQY